jgi:hypothetical protein
MTGTDVKDLFDGLVTTAPEPCGDAVAEVHRRVGRRGRLVPVAIGLATVVALLAAVGVVSTFRRSGSAPPATPLNTSAEQSALAAGREFAGSFFTVDYRDVDRYSEAVEAGSTGEFRRNFSGKRTELRATLTQVRSVASADVRAAAARAVTPTSATALVVVDQSVRNTVSKEQPAVNRFRIREELRLVNGRWLVEALDPVVGGGPGGCADPTAAPEQAALLAQTCVATERVFSFDYRTLNGDLAAQRAVTTGPFTDEVEQVTGPALRPVAAKEHVRVQATAADAAVEQADSTSATVLVFLNQTVTVGVLPEPRIDRNRVEVSMTKVDGRWLISGLRAL